MCPWKSKKPEKKKDQQWAVAAAVGCCFQLPGSRGGWLEAKHHSWWTGGGGSGQARALLGLGRCMVVGSSTDEADEEEEGRQQNV